MVKHNHQLDPLIYLRCQLLKVIRAKNTGSSCLAMIDATSLGIMASCCLELCIIFDLAIYKDALSMFRSLNHILQMPRACMTRPHEDLKVCYCGSRRFEILIIFLALLTSWKILGMLL